jgi:tRNA dimethylallyltransferase
VTAHLAIVGPTATGKSAVALGLARRHDDLEIVSLDAMQVYRGMDIGTAKPLPGELSEVPHHGIDLVDPSEPWSVARTQAMARAAVAAIEARGKRALLVGGTGLYVQAVIDDFELPGEDLTVRAELERETSAPGGLLAAWDELRRIDPAAAARIDERNQRRIVRALEVIRITGRPFSSFGPGVFAAVDARTAFRVRLVGLWTPRAELARRIARRVEMMRERGLVDEVCRLRSTGWSRGARQAIGYKEIASALDTGPTPESLADAFDLVVRRTRSFARRQRMWFRRDPRIVWVRAGDPIDLVDALSNVDGAARVRS